MKTLLLIRHAKSGWDETSLSDFDRTLNARGLKSAEEMAKRLIARQINFDAFFSSPAIRAKTTAEIFAETFNMRADQLFFEQGLYLAHENYFEQFISNIDNSLNTVAIFSHNPGITEFANTLTPALKTDNIPTCGIFAVKAATSSWNGFSATGKELLFYDYPKLSS